MDTTTHQHRSETATTIARKALAGVWKRVLLKDDTASTDRESLVYWIQGARLCGDIREHRLNSALTAAFRESGPPAMDAFAGELIETDGIFRWEHALSLNGAEGPPDEGRLRWIDGDLWEEGVHMAYSEQWTRIAEASAGDFAVALDDDRGRQAYVLRVGAFLFQALAGEGFRASFSLFERKPEGIHVVLSSAGSGPVACPTVEFGDGEAVWLSTIGGEGDPERWRVTAFDDCGMSTPASGRIEGGVVVR